jgi:hypothetical protein
MKIYVKVNEKFKNLLEYSKKNQFNNSRLMAIILYIASHLVYFFHQRKKLLNAQPSLINDSPEDMNEEEQQMTNYIRDQEDK